MTDVFLRYDDNARSEILKKFSEIYEVLCGQLRFKRKHVCEDRNEKLDYVYISTNPDSKTSTIYDKFFEHDEYFEKIFTRSSLLIHEAAHRTGLREEAGSEVLLNAENYRKFVCILFGIATFEEMYPKGNVGKTKPLKSNIGRLEFPNPDQPRDDNGRWEKTSKEGVKTSAKFNNNTPIQTNEIGEIWGAFDVLIDGLKPNTPYTIRISPEYEQSDLDGKTIEPLIDNNNPSWAYEGKSGDKGELELKRVGILAQDGNNRVSDYQGGNIKGKVKIDIYEGGFDDNFNEADKLTWNIHKGEDTPPKDVELQNRYGLGAYGAAHASNNAYIDKKYISGNKGGGVYGQEAKKSPVKSETYKFGFDKSSKKSYFIKSEN